MTMGESGQKARWYESSRMSQVGNLRGEGQFIWPAVRLEGKGSDKEAAREGKLWKGNHLLFPKLCLGAYAIRTIQS
jgi:hypothetical protein